MGDKPGALPADSFLRKFSPFDKALVEPLLLKVNIDCVDGDSFFSSGSSDTPENRKWLLEFLMRYDHEGSSVSLEVSSRRRLGPNQWITEQVHQIDDPEQVYRILGGGELPELP